MSDPYDLQRFVVAQSGGVLEQALSELSRGRKTSHWMWFVFPQVAGLGRSELAVRYAISGLPEAAAYLAHPVLRERLAACAETLMSLDGPSATDVLGGVDAAKLRSSMTLFTAVDDHPGVLDDVLAHYFDGEPDRATLDLLGR